jgi:hypothetical protein
MDRQWSEAEKDTGKGIPSVFDIPARSGVPGLVETQKDTERAIEFCVSGVEMGCAGARAALARPGFGLESIGLYIY